jgi:hypothetical protein
MTLKRQFLGMVIHTRNLKKLALEVELEIEREFI